LRSIVAAKKRNDPRRHRRTPACITKLHAFFFFSAAHRAGDSRIIIIHIINRTRPLLQAKDNAPIASRDASPASTMTHNTSKEFEFIQALTAELSSNELIFPTSLNATMKIRHALNVPDISIDNIARAVGAEPVLSAHILRLCNSAAFNQTGSAISDLRKATLRLGLSMVRNVAISVGMKQLVQSRSSSEVPRLIDGLWKRCIRISALSYVIAKKLTRVNPDAAMMAGLLLNIGKFYILNRAHAYTELFSDETALWELVDRWHANIGTAILESWEVPEEISNAVLNGADFNYTHRGPPNLSDVVAAADFLDGKFYSGSEAAMDWHSVPQTLIALNLDEEKSAALIAETKDELTLIFQAIA
jgi:HD-like signal output (HDOD) protein